MQLFPKYCLKKGWMFLLKNFRLSIQQVLNKNVSHFKALGMIPNGWRGVPSGFSCTRHLSPRSAVLHFVETTPMIATIAIWLLLLKSCCSNHRLLYLVTACHCSSRHRLVSHMCQHSHKTRCVGKFVGPRPQRPCSLSCQGWKHRHADCAISSKTLSRASRVYVSFSGKLKLNNTKIKKGKEKENLMLSK